MKLSLIVPARNEAASIRDCLSSIRREFSGEVLVIDGQSKDETVALASSLASQVIRSEIGLAKQCNLGAATAAGDWLFFVSADCRLPPGWLAALSEGVRARNLVAGGFRLDLDDEDPFFRVIAWGGNFRSRYLGVALPDQGLFIRKETFEKVGGMEEESLIPFVRLCIEAKRHGAFRLLPLSMVASARQWKSRGRLATTWAHILTYLRFRRTELPGWVPFD